MAGPVVADELVVALKIRGTKSELGSTIAAKEPRNIDKK